MQNLDAIITEKVNEHIEKVYLTVNSLNRAIVAMEKGDQAYISEIQTAMKMEEDADSIRRDIMNKLAVSSVEAHMEHDIIDFVNRIDDIADSAKDAARILYICSPRGYPSGVYSDIMQIGDLLNESAEDLKEAMQTIETDPEKARTLILRIEKCENFIDGIYLNILAWLMSDAARSVTPGQAVALRELVFFLEATADNLEDTADVMSMIIERIQPKVQ